ncbi:MAG: SPFH domain-containing protein [Planctomycetota bacterium]
MTLPLIMVISTAGWFWIIVGVLFVAAVAVYATNYQKVGPNEVLIVSGGIKRTVIEDDGTERKVGYKMRIGGGSFVMPFIQTAQILPLEIVTVQVKADEALTKNGIQLNAVGLAQVKVGSSEGAIRMAAEQFLGRGVSAIKEATNQVLEGLLRAYLGSETVVDVYQNRDEFNAKMAKDAGGEIVKMGLELISFTLIDISDKQGYLAALGKPQIAAVKRDAEIAEAETDKETIIKTAEARMAGDVARLKAETEVAKANRDFEIARAGYAAEVNQKKASADMAYELERQKEAGTLKEEELAVRIIERTKMIELEELEIKRKEKELMATVEKTAAARQKQIQTEATAEAFRLEAEAKGRAKAAQLDAEAEASALRMKGEAEADAMSKKADAYAEYNQAAVYEMLFEILPDLARAVSEPLSQVDKMVVIDSGSETGGASKITGQVANVLSQVPSVIEAISGLDITKLGEGLKSASEKKPAAKKPAARKTAAKGD